MASTSSNLPSTSMSTTSDKGNTKMLWIILGVVFVIIVVVLLILTFTVFIPSSNKKVKTNKIKNKNKNKKQVLSKPPTQQNIEKPKEIEPIKPTVEVPKKVETVISDPIINEIYDEKSTFSIENREAKSGYSVKINTPEPIIEDKNEKEISKVEIKKQEAKTEDPLNIVRANIGIFDKIYYSEKVLIKDENEKVEKSEKKDKKSKEKKSKKSVDDIDQVKDDTLSKDSEKVKKHRKDKKKSIKSKDEKHKKKEKKITFEDEEEKEVERKGLGEPLKYIKPAYAKERKLENDEENTQSHHLKKMVDDYKKSFIEN